MGAAYKKKRKKEGDSPEDNEDHERIERVAKGLAAAFSKDSQVEEREAQFDTGEAWNLHQFDSPNSLDFYQ